VTDGENEGGDCVGYDTIRYDTILCRMRWTRRTVNRMRLMEWRRELIPQVRWGICERAVGDL